MVTGANKGIGKEIVKQLAELGYQVFLGSRDEARGQAAVDELRGLGLDVHLQVLDVTSDESVKEAAKQLASRVEALHVLVNNAGVLAAGFKTALLESFDEVKTTFDVNVFGAIRTVNAFTDLIKKAGPNGRIVNVSSGMGSFALTTDKSNLYFASSSLSYSSSKSALNHITVCYAKAFAEFGVKVNSADPGYTATDLNANTGPQSVAEGAKSTIFLATLPHDGPTGSFYDKDGIVPW